MELVKISEATKMFNTTTRTLRYYEEIGLIKSRRIDDYAYRVYDERTLRRLHSIFILRKLTIPLEKIKFILDNNQTSMAVEVFNERLKIIDDEIYALDTIKSIIESFIIKISKNVELDIDKHLLSNSALEIIDSITTLNKQKKEKKSMSDLSNASKIVEKVRDVRIVYLPPTTVASSQYIGENPEDKAESVLREFVHKNKLYDIKPDFRMYGFNNPNVDENYIEEKRPPLGMDGSLEEHLNAYTYYKENRNDEFFQLDLLIPIKEK